MSSNYCVVCENRMNRQKSIKCRTCDNACHSECVSPGLTSETWRCRKCREPTLADLMDEIRKLTENNNTIARSLDSCHERIEENNALIKAQDIKITACLDKIENLSQKCKILENENTELKKALNSQEQYSRRNCIEVYGMPESKEENIFATVFQISRAIGVKLDKEDIDACHRLRSQPRSKEPRPIIIKFVSRWKKDEIIQARRVRRTLSLQDIDASLKGTGEGKKPIYINESLTKDNRILLSKCKEFKKKNNIKFLWTRNGKILMRKSDNAQIYIIESVSNLTDVH